MSYCVECGCGTLTCCRWGLRVRKLYPQLRSKTTRWRLTWKLTKTDSVAFVGEVKEASIWESSFSWACAHLCLSGCLELYFQKANERESSVLLLKTHIDNLLSDFSKVRLFYYPILVQWSVAYESKSPASIYISVQPADRVIMPYDCLSFQLFFNFYFQSQTWVVSHSNTVPFVGPDSEAVNVFSNRRMQTHINARTHKSPRARLFWSGSYSTIHSAAGVRQPSGVCAQEPLRAYVSLTIWPLSC